ncbi:hypothetical protein HPB49_017052 [Dermacentor silvarum]|uniref:Uncharacterized protein n=1 Tax=Dermacentor silvarum TaxID=543639 RepID=A0ACB8CLY2_DERSI|nr:hypothetical protein HPB49_017052 [Dermacentor silvarum]
MLLLRCTLYKRQIDPCRNCGRVGHRQDVCPTPSEKVCEHCGIKPTGPDHVCVTPKCALCGQAHITGDRTCRNRYQIPYVVTTTTNRPKEARPSNSRRPSNQPRVNRRSTCLPPPRVRLQHLPGPTKSPVKVRLAVPAVG